MSTIKANAILDASGGNTVTINSVTPTAYNTMGKNLVINGDMRIDQRLSGGSTTTINGYHSVDRWTLYGGSLTGKGTYGQNYGGVTPPAGFTNYWGWQTGASAYSVAAADLFSVFQPIEGYNVAHLGFGSVGASSITISFWVRSSLTGTFGAAVFNSSQNYNYPFGYTINAANTWEKKTVTISGATAGTWLTTNGIGLYINFEIASGSNWQGASGAWTTTNYHSVTGAVSVLGTANATWYITGVQLEAGSVATEFERRPYGTELNLCYRYFQKTNPDNVSLRSGGLNGVVYSSTNCVMYYTLPVLMRSAPSIARGGTNDNFYIAGISSSISGTFNSAFSSAGTVWAEIINLSGGGNGYGIQYNGQLSLSSEL